MYCPLHEDAKRSASLNVLSGEWFCFAGCGGGRVTELISRRGEWLDPEVAHTNGHAKPKAGRSAARPKETITEGKIGGWHSALMADDVALEDLIVKRGLTTDTIVKYEIGYDRDDKVYTIPVRGPEGEIWNVRKYNMYPPPGRRKIWGVTDMNDARLYPISIFESDPEEVLVDEGEWDTLLNNQNSGLPTVTRTGSAKVWRGEWNEWFKGRIVYLGHDCDKDGQAGNRVVGRALSPIADVRVMEMPYPIKEKHGEDWTDFWAEHDRADFEQIKSKAKPFKSKRGATKQPDTVTVIESFDAKKVGDPVRLIATVRGRKEPGYSVPKKVRMSCTQDAGNKCTICPMNAQNGEVEFEVPADDPVILSLVESTTNQVVDELVKLYGAQKCNRKQIEVEEHQAVEVLFGRPSLDHSDGTKTHDYKSIRITNVGKHDTQTNTTVAVTGARFANPRSQANEFLAWNIEQMETSVDRFDLDKVAIASMKRFQPRAAQRPMKKLGEIARDLAEHVTQIRGRPEMHALMELTFHSVLGFKFSGQMIHRGWLETLIVGDTRTGKSEAATQLVRHYGAGEIIGCESASYAGIVGGAQQLGGKEWIITWGAIPLNDRRAVVLDEIEGLTTEEISRMSDVRSSGMAKITMIAQEATHARTRLLWLGNPRTDIGLSAYTYGVDSLRPLIGKPEDIARFDLAMAASIHDVRSEDINQPYRAAEMKYTAEACHTLLMWTWTRQPDQIVWTPGAEKRVFDLANQMGKRYVEIPPLVQAANIRIKIARVAAAIAARLFSTDETYERVVIRKEHVEDAVAFIDRIYEMQVFGYAERSREYIEDRKEAERNKKDIETYLENYLPLTKFLRGTSKFRRQDLEEVLNTSREGANSIISTLHEARMVRKELGDIRIEPTLHSLLREMKA